MSTVRRALVYATSHGHPQDLQESIQSKLDYLHNELDAIVVSVATVPGVFDYEVIVTIIYHF